MLVHKKVHKKEKYQKLFLTVQRVYDMITIVADRAISIA